MQKRHDIASCLLRYLQLYEVFRSAVVLALTHQLPLGLPVRLAHGHQKIHSLSDLLKVRGSKGILVQMLQNTATFEETFERVLSNRKANGLSDKTLQTCNNR